MKDRRSLVLALAVLIVAPLTVGCAAEMKFRLLAPINRETNGSDEEAQVARARQLLAGGVFAPGDVIALLRAQGQTEDEAKRIVALAMVPEKK